MTKPARPLPKFWTEALLLDRTAAAVGELVGLLARTGRAALGIGEHGHLEGWATEQSSLLKSKT